MQNKSIAFISSPFQLLCLKEFIEEKRIEKIEIIFIQTNSSEIHNKQFFLTARYLNLKITKINHLRLRLNYIKYTAKFFLKKVKFLIVGDHFNSHFVFLSIIIKYKFFFIIDDGMSSIVIGEKDILSRSLVSKLYPKNKTYYTIFKNNRLENYIINHSCDIEHWFRTQWLENTAPFYASVDLRNSGFKLTPVDTNLFPGGFNNLNPILRHSQFKPFQFL